MAVAPASVAYEFTDGLLPLDTPPRDVVPYMLGVLDLGAEQLAARETPLTRAVTEP